MAEDLDDGEFWLPPHFLTDDDILMDFGFSPPTKPDQGGLMDHGFTSNSDLDFTSGSTETESDEEDIVLAGLTRKMGRVALEDSSCPVHSKGTVLSSSPQSTLCGCVCNQGSSRDSPSGPVSPPQPPPKDNEKDSNATLDLLNKAAGEVARLKMKTDDSSNNNNCKKSTGTGFFDCSQKGILYPAPLRNPDLFPPLYFQPQFHHFPPMVWSPSVGAQYNQPKQQPPQQNRATKNNNNQNNKSTNNNRPLGLPPSAWPPLQAQNQAQAHNMQPAPVFPRPKRECAGTGVFLPRRVTPSDTRKKSEGNTNTTKTKNGKGSQSQSQSTNRRNSRTTQASANQGDIQLPQEWTY